MRRAAAPAHAAHGETRGAGVVTTGDAAAAAPGRLAAGGAGTAAGADDAAVCMVHSQQADCLAKAAGNCSRRAMLNKQQDCVCPRVSM